MKSIFLCACLLLGLSPLFLRAESTLETGWQNSPNDARLRAYWWWLNGNVTKASITHDLEEMKAKGFGGAVIFDANGANQDGNGTVPHGPTFFSPEWRELYKHTLREADRLGLEISLNIQSGWNLGGPVVTKEDAAKKYVWSETRITGGTNVILKLPQPKAREDFYRDIATIAYRIENSTPPAPLKNWKQKALQESLTPSSAPDSAPLFAEIAATPGEQDADAAEVLNLTGNLSADGTLRWDARDAPAGDWEVLRFGYTIGDRANVSTSSDGWGGFALDVYSAAAFQNYWGKIVAPLIADAGPLAGKSLKYLHTDSWEIELANWTPAFREEFKKRHGYDLLPWLPVLAGRIVNSRAESDRFLFDYRKTLGDLAIDNHYRLFGDNAHKYGIGIHPESGGPHAVPIDAQRCLGWDDAPMSEFWAWSWTHRVGDANRFFVKQPASAAHTYGHKFVFAEGFTTIGPNWQEKIWDNLKPSFDKALCEGLNVLVWHAFVCSPDETGIPGQQYFAGTHLNPKVTWWEKSAPFFSYINRCQWLLQQGHFAADVLYYYGDHVPNFTQHKHTDPAHIGSGFDYDVITEEALIERASVRDGKIFLPDGINYRVLVLPDRDVISLPVLKKIKELVAGGATVIGPKPARGETLENFSATDAEVAKLADELWGGKAGTGRVIAGKTAREVLLADGIQPDCEFIGAGSVPLDYIHRTTGDAEIYFVANRSTNAAAINCAFRVTGKVPELWNAVSGERKFAAAYEEKDGRTFVPLDFAPCGSWFVVFREPATGHPALAKANVAELKPVQEISGAWTVHFDPKWGGPETAQFDSLVSWPTRPEPGIKFYSGTAVYEKTFDLPASKLKTQTAKLFLDLGAVREIAEVKVNGQSCGTVWCPPWRVDVTDAVKPGENKLQVEVVNFWPNRIIGDASLPKKQRLTQTNIRRLTAQTPPEPAGLFGPVELVRTSISTANGSAHETGSLTLPLWPGQPPGKVSGKPETELPARGGNVRRITDVQRPSITVFSGGSTNRLSPAVVICPGGGYGHLVINKEGTEVAEWLNSIGIIAVFLKYRVPGNREGAFMDAQRAIRLVRQHAKDWNIDPQCVGMIGFSAGGHLTARLSTGYETQAYPDLDAADQQSCRPDFAILIYPASLADKQGRLASELVVTPQTPRTFLVHTKDDKTFVAGSLAYAEALKEAHVASEFHLFDTGGHGYGLRPSTNAVSNWPKLCQQWLLKTIKEAPGK